MTTLFGDSAVLPIVVPKAKRSLLPVLILLFVVSYGLMTMLIVEQNAAIQSQNNLIKVLLPESRQLWAIRGKSAVDKQAASAQAQGRAKGPSNQARTSSDQPASNQAGSNQAASNQVPQHRSQKPTARPDAETPPVPTSDLLDQRRSLHTI